MLEWSINQREHPVMILLPGNEVDYREADKNYNDINKFKMEQEGEKVAIIALGDFFQKGEKLSKKIESEFGFKPSLINPRFASGTDKNMLEKLKENHKLVITLEDGILDGGFGQKIASFYGDSLIKVKNYGLKKMFYDRYNPDDLLVSEKMDVLSIINYIKNNI